MLTGVCDAAFAQRFHFNFNQMLRNYCAHTIFFRIGYEMRYFSYANLVSGENVVLTFVRLKNCIHDSNCAVC